MERTASISRKTFETDINADVNIDGSGKFDIDTGIGFFDHMLQLMSKHGLMDLKCICKGDINVDGHHTVEDTGICIGTAINKALGTKESIRRYSTVFIPMDEALVMVSIDISGRPFIHFDCDFKSEMVGNFDTQLTVEFFRALAFNSGITLHINKIYGENSHHIIEAIFKGFGRAFHQASSIDPEIKGVPSTKGVL